MWGIFSSLLDALLPPHRDVRIARAFVKSGIDTVVSPREAGATWISALLPYRDARVRALVRAVKYYGEITALSGAGKILGEYLLGIIAEKQALSGWEEPLLIPIPASRVRVRERGYNQAERIALSALPIVGSAATYAPNILFREDRKSQVSVERSKRTQNVRGAFFVPDAEKARGKYIILIDDVIESGSTFIDARRALIKAGAKEVIAVALAH